MDTIRKLKNQMYNRFENKGNEQLRRYSFNHNDHLVVLQQYYDPQSENCKEQVFHKGMFSEKKIR